MEYRDEFPKSTLEGRPIPGKIALFQYTAKTAEQLPYYDRNPLCYLIAVERGTVFWGVNLHYHRPENRLSIMRYIDAGEDLARLRGFHKYLKSYVRSPFLTIATEEWDKAVNLDSEKFVRDFGSVEIDIDPDTVYRKGTLKN